MEWKTFEEVNKDKNLGDLVYISDGEKVWFSYLRPLQESKHLRWGKIPLPEPHKIEESLKPCPFCGSDQITKLGRLAQSHNIEYVFCPCCLAEGPKGQFIKHSWNKRYKDEN